MLVIKLVTHANKEGFGLIFLSGDRHGNLPPLLKTKQTIPCQILLQVCRIGEMAEAPKLFLSSPSPEREAVLPQSDDTGKSLSEAFFLENMLCTEIVLNVQNNFCKQHVLPMF